MQSRLSVFAGIREKSPNLGNDRAEIIAWHHPEFIRAYHVALKITKAGVTHYLSISAETFPRYAKKSLFNLLQGRPAYFYECYEDEMLVQAFRSSHEDSKALSAERQAELKSIECHAHKITLRSLDLDAMIEKIKFFKSPQNKIKYALWSGTHTYLYQANTYNCATAVLETLRVGGFNDLIETKNDLFGKLGLLLAAAYTLTNQLALQEAVITIAAGFFVGRGLGAAYEGYTGVQSYLNRNAQEGHLDSTLSAVGFRMLSTALSALVGTFKPGLVVPTVIATPIEVLNLANHAKMEEEARYLFDNPKRLRA
jgi:hypothetical protein